MDASPDPAEVAASLRAVVAAIDRGEVAADEAQRAYLTGAAAALEALGARESASSPVFEHPSVRETPHSPCNPTLPNSSTSSCTMRASTTGSNRSRSARAPPLLGRTLHDAAIRRTTGALLLALRRPDGPFLANPDPNTPIEAHSVLIVLGTTGQLTAVRRRAGAT